MSEVIAAVAARVSITEYVVYKRTSVHHREITVRLYFQTAKRWN